MPDKVPAPVATLTVLIPATVTALEVLMVFAKDSAVPVVMIRVPVPNPLLWLRAITPWESVVPPE